MRLHIHQLDPQKHLDFIEQEREDPVTGEFLEAGDEIVICAGCQSAFLAETWEYLGKKHCHQSRTLPAIPDVQSLTLKKNKKRFVIGTKSLERAPAWQRGMALLIDGLVGLLASIFFILPMAGIYFWFRDGLDNGRSIGKTWMKLQTLNTQTGQACTWRESFRRNFLPGLFLSYGHLFAYASILTGGSDIVQYFFVVTGGLIAILTTVFMVVRILAVFTNSEDGMLNRTRVVRYWH
ncbi:MAG: RDD family protein [Bacteroidota bacterium]